MKIKKLMSLALAGVMTLSLAVPAFAADPEGLGNLETTIEGTYAAADIDVVVPQTGNVYVNPYGLAATATKSDGTTKVPLAGDVMSIPMSIKNRSTSYLSVGAEVSVVVPDTSGIKLASEALTDDITGKTIYAQLEVVRAPDSVTGDDTSEANTKALNDKVIDASAVEDNWAGSGKVVLNSRSAVAGEMLATMKPATMNNGAFSSYGAGSIAMFRISGDCAAVSSRDPWAETDTFTVNVVFNFAPFAPTTYGVTVDTATKTGQAQLGTVSADKANAEAGETVTVTATVSSTNATYDKGVVTVTAGDQPIDVTALPVEDGDAGAKLYKYTFVMPEAAVVVHTVFQAI